MGMSDAAMNEGPEPHVTIWCLIIRTAYQGVLFEFLSSDGRKQVTTNMDNLIARNITVHYNEFVYNAFGSDTFNK